MLVFMLVFMFMLMLMVVGDMKVFNHCFVFHHMKYESYIVLDVVVFFFCFDLHHHERTFLNDITPSSSP